MRLGHSITRFIFLIAFTVPFTMSWAQKTDDYSVVKAEKVFNMDFERRYHDFGKVKRGDKVTTQFSFTNKGTEDIEIELVSACECTTLDWPRKAVKPGEKAVIDVVFDSTEKEESETIEIDINLKNRDPKTGYPRLEILSYTYELVL